MMMMTMVVGGTAIRGVMPKLHVAVGKLAATRRMGGEARNHEEDAANPSYSLHSWDSQTGMVQLPGIA
jgi:hypothetical protein